MSSTVAWSGCWAVHRMALAGASMLALLAALPWLSACSSAVPVKFAEHWAAAASEARPSLQQAQGAAQAASVW